MAFAHKHLYILALCLALVGCAAKSRCIKGTAPYTIKGQTYYPFKYVQPGYTQDGVASWYGPGFHGRKTANGEVYNMHEFTAAHNVLPLNSIVRVVNPRNKKAVVVRINDRGPFVDNRVLDLSLAAAKELGMVGSGTAPVRITVLPNDAPSAAPGVAPFPAGFAKCPNPFFNGSSYNVLAFRR